MGIIYCHPFRHCLRSEYSEDTDHGKRVVVVVVVVVVIIVVLLLSLVTGFFFLELLLNHR
jgi:hypothetical protein